MKKIIIVIFSLFIFSCAEQASIQKIVVGDFNTSVFDTLKNDKGIILSNIISHNKTYIYLANNECSECISKFIDFNDVLHKSNIYDEYNVVYIIYGCDKLTFDYYMDRENVSFNSKIHIVNDSLDVFHEKIHNFYSNALFYIDEDTTVYSIRNYRPEYEWNFNDIIKATK